LQFILCKVQVFPSNIYIFYYFNAFLWSLKSSNMSSFTHPHVVPNPSDFPSSLEYQWWNLKAFCPFIDSNCNWHFDASTRSRIEKRIELFSQTYLRRLYHSCV